MILKFLWRNFKARYRDQRAEISAITASISPGDIAVDVGANKGSYLLWLSRAAESVVAFVPQPLLAEYLRKVCEVTGLDNVTVEQGGVSDSNGNLPLYVPGDSTSPSASFETVVSSSEPCRIINVPVYVLDDYFASRSRRIAALKIDVEGHELSVLKGAKQILSQDAPCVVLECESRHLAHGTVHEVLNYVLSFGYTGHFVQQGKVRPISEFDPAVHQRAVGGRFWDSQDYCNNFIFRKGY